MTDLTERLEAWAVRGRMLHPYEVKPLLLEAATTLETLTQEVERLRELSDAACSNAETALNFLAEAGRSELAKIQAIYVANIRKALGGGDE